MLVFTREEALFKTASEHKKVCAWIIADLLSGYPSRVGTFIEPLLGERKTIKEARVQASPLKNECSSIFRC